MIFEQRQDDEKKWWIYNEDDAHDDDNDHHHHQRNAHFALEKIICPWRRWSAVSTRLPWVLIPSPLDPIDPTYLVGDAEGSASTTSKNHGIWMNFKVVIPLYFERNIPNNYPCDIRSIYRVDDWRAPIPRVPPKNPDKKSHRAPG